MSGTFSLGGPGRADSASGPAVLSVHELDGGELAWQFTNILQPWMRPQKPAKAGEERWEHRCREHCAVQRRQHRRAVLRRQHGHAILRWLTDKHLRLGENKIEIWIIQQAPTAAHLVGMNGMWVQTLKLQARLAQVQKYMRICIVTQEGKCRLWTFIKLKGKWERGGFSSSSNHWSTRRENFHSSPQIQNSAESTNHTEIRQVTVN